MGSFFAVAGARLVRALFALPRQIIATTQRGGSVTWSDPGKDSRRETARPERTERAVIGLLTAGGATAAALVLLFALGRAIYYPFWAAGAKRDALARSWGGPGPVGATLAHWLVAAVTIVLAYVFIVAMERLARGRWS